MSRHSITGRRRSDGDHRGQRQPTERPFDATHHSADVCGLGGHQSNGLEVVVVKPGLQQIQNGQRFYLLMQKPLKTWAYQQTTV